MKKTVILFIVLIVSAFLIFALQKESEDVRTVIKFSAWGSQSETAILKPLLDQFEKENPDIRVEFVHIPQNYFQKLHLLFASNLAPDVVFLNNYYAPKYYKAGLLQDLTPYFKEEIKDKIFFDKALKSSSYDNKIYVIPRDVSAVVVYYNKDIFDKYKVPYPKSDWTIQDFKQTAKRLTKDVNKDGRTDIWGTGFEREPVFWLPFLFSNGGGIIDNDKIIINEPQSMNALKEYTDLAHRDKSAPSKNESASLTMAQLFINGQIAMQISGRWLVPKYRKDAHFNWDVVNFPHGKKGSVVGLDSSGYAISAASKHKVEAVKLIKFLSSKASVQKLAQSGLIVPARKDAACSKEFLAPYENSKPQNAKVFIDIIETAKPTPVNANYGEIIDKVNKSLEHFF